MHAPRITMSLALLLFACSAEPAGSDMAPVQGGLGPSEPAAFDSPKSPLTTPCTSMVDTQLDFRVDTDAGTIYSYEAAANVDGASSTQPVTLYVLDAVASGGETVPLAFEVYGGGTVTLVDAKGNAKTFTSGTFTASVLAPLDASFEIQAKGASGTGKPTSNAGPDPLAKRRPPISKKAVIKPVTRCPA